MARRPVKKSDSEKSLVPILFTIGVIGWGFFAIDRILSPPDSSIIEKRQTGAVQKRQEKESGGGVRDWLLSFIEKKHANKVAETRNIPKTIPEKDRELPVLPEDPLSGFSMQAKTDLKQTISVYLYSLDKDGTPVLKKIKRNVPVEDSIGSAFQEVINGPTAREEQLDFIDSFPAKPMILGVNHIDDTIILNLDDQFGTGVSFQSLKFQLKQLWKTAAQFPGVKNLKIRINGREVKHLGGDGAPLPAVINSSTFSS